jgi:hypothetical protein
VCVCNVLGRCSRRLQQPFAFPSSRLTYTGGSFRRVPSPSHPLPIRPCALTLAFGASFCADAYTQITACFCSVFGMLVLSWTEFQFIVVLYLHCTRCFHKLNASIIIPHFRLHVFSVSRLALLKPLSAFLRHIYLLCLAARGVIEEQHND